MTNRDEPDASDQVVAADGSAPVAEVGTHRFKKANISEPHGTRLAVVDFFTIEAETCDA
jgi:hypothetical protein